MPFTLQEPKHLACQTFDLLKVKGLIFIPLKTSLVREYNFPF